MENRLRASNDRASLFRRFGAYALGIAIGLMFLGLIQSQRAAYRARMSEELRQDARTPPADANQTPKQAPAEGEARAPSDPPA